MAASAWPILTDDQGSPIIPLGSAEELSYLQSVALLHGGRLREIDEAGIGGRSRITRKGSVVGVGSTGTKLAGFYAHLTGRPSGDSIVAGHDPWSDAAVIIAAMEDVTQDLLSEVHRASLIRRSAIGLIVGPNETETGRAAKRAAVALACAGRRNGGRLGILTSLEQGSRRGPAEMFLGPEANSQDIAAAMADGASTLIVVAHSSGFDAVLSPDTYLCPMTAGFGSVDRRGPLCAELGRCTREPDLPLITEARTAGRLVAPEEIRAECLILLGCSVLRTPDHVIGPALALGSTISCRSRIGIALTCWGREFVSMDGREIYPLANDLNSGMCSGEAIWRSNAATSAQPGGLKLCLLGDPDYRLRPDPRLEDLETSAAQHFWRPEDASPPSSAAKIAVMSSIAADAARRCRKKPAAVVRAREHFEALSERMAQDAPVLPLVAAGEASRSFVTALSFARSSVSGILGQHFLQGAPEGAARCPACGQSATSGASPSRAAASGRLLFTTCEHCRAHEMLFERVPTFDLSNSGQGAIGLFATDSGLAAAIRVATHTLFARDDSDRRHSSLAASWPRDQRGRLEPAVVLPDNLPAGPLVCSAILAGPGSFAVSEFHLRAEHALGGQRQLRFQRI